MNDISLYDYQLPESLIAQKPLALRDSCNLLILNCSENKFVARKFFQLLEYLQPGDCLVLNNSRVIPARVFGRKITGGKVEILFLSFQPPRYQVLLSPGVSAGGKIIFPDNSLAKVVDNNDGEFVLDYDRSVRQLLDKYGLMPLPPYIRRPANQQDRIFYQTVYARKDGSIAAPTAGLHFSEKMLANLQAKGVKIVEIVLHVGPGTFRPMKVNDVRQHQMQPEYYEISPEAAEIINKTRKSQHRLFVVGTTAVRALEHSAADNGQVRSGSGFADIFIYPGYQFKVVKNLLTNFHLPRSTPLLLVCALAGREKIFSAYKWAIEQQWRFFSYGDAMLISRE